ncbi:MAG: hypothetical protein JXQ75_17865 [Phycisphaerae bacterium]|nr:hypothetical protein [Phycisphaerae bacterium]
MCIFYGQAKNDYGWPYMKNADVELRVGTNVYARHTITGSLKPGVNFALYVQLDDGSESNKYAFHSLRTGDAFDIVVIDGEGERTILEASWLPPVGMPGEVILINVTSGVDTDGDGIPDTWEQELIDWGTNPGITSLVQVVGSDDYDGDGQPNIDEYGAGTFAFLYYDYFFAEYMEQTANNWLMLEFLSVPGKIYQVYCTTSLTWGAWAPCDFALTELGPLQTTPTEGDGDWLSLYVPMTETGKTVRLHVQ